MNTKKRYRLFAHGDGFILVPVVLITLLVFVPMVMALVTSFKSGSPVNMSFSGLSNYKRMLSDTTFRKAFSNTFLYLIIQVPIMIRLRQDLCVNGKSIPLF